MWQTLSNWYHTTKGALSDAVGWCYGKLKSQDRNITRIATVLRGVMLPLGAKSTKSTLVVGVISNWLMNLASYLSLRHKKEAINKDRDSLDKGTQIPEAKIGGLFYAAQGAFVAADLLLLALMIGHDDPPLSFLIVNGFLFIGSALLDGNREEQFSNSQTAIISALKIELKALQVEPQAVANIGDRDGAVALCQPPALELKENQDLVRGLQYAK